MARLCIFSNSLESKDESKDVPPGGIWITVTREIKPPTLSKCLLKFADIQIGNPEQKNETR